MSFLADFKDSRVSVITTDGRFFVGKLESYDNSTNIVLSQTQEIILADVNDPEDETQIIELGVYFIRGSCVVCCGQNDELIESQIDWQNLKSEPLKTTKLKS